jgi:urea transport system permease protein
VDALTFGLGSGIAGVAGVALSQLDQRRPQHGPGLHHRLLHGRGLRRRRQPLGHAGGGLTLGVANKFMEPWTGAVLAKILVLVFIILFIQKRPRGLFPQRGGRSEG